MTRSITRPVYGTAFTSPDDPRGTDCVAGWTAWGRWLVAGILCVLLLGVTACGRAEPSAPQPVAKNDDPPAPTPPLPHPQLPVPSPPPAGPKSPDNNTGAKLPKAPDSTPPTPPGKANPQEPQPFKVKQIATLPAKGMYSISALGFSPDGKTLAVGGNVFETRPKQPDRPFVQLQLWDVAERKNTKNLKKIEGFSISSIAFSPTDKTLVSTLAAEKTGSALLWDATTGENINTFSAPKPLYSVAFSPDGKTIAAGGQADKKIQLWDVNTGKRTTLPGLGLFVAFSPDGKTLATAGYEGDGMNSELKFWNVPEGKCTATLTPKGLISCLAFSPDGKTLFTGAAEWGKSDGSLEVWDVAGGKKTRTVSIDNRKWAMSSDGRLLASASTDAKTVKLWDVVSGKVVAELGHTDAVTVVAFSRDGTKVATAMQGQNSVIHVWELSGGPRAPAPNQ